MLDINDGFLDEQILVTALEIVTQYTDFANFVVTNIILEDLSFH